MTFDPAVYAARRARLAEALGPRAVLVVASLPERLRNNDAHYHFRQHSDVLWLTGFTEPGTTVVLRPGCTPTKLADGTELLERFVMFVRPRDPEMETWDGRRAGIEGAVHKYGADNAYPVSELENRLWDLVGNFDELHFALGLDPELDGRVTRAIARLRRSEKKGKRPPRAVVDPRSALHELRLHKQPEELAALRRAAEISAEAHVEAMKLGRPGAHERDLEAVIDYTFRRKGANGPGYNTIVGAGDNATILHYVESASPIGASDLVLVDAGCEVDHYTADITRTWPASGKFTEAQRDVYARVLAVQKAAIARCVPGATIDEIHEFCIRELTAAMIELGLLEGTVEARVEDLTYKKFYMHGTSHWLGLDVHDVGAYTQDGKARPLVPDMVITVEPGLYIPANAENVPDRLRGIGVRIEDDIAITADGHDVLTRACPKEIAELEEICRR